MSYNNQKFMATCVSAEIQEVGDNETPCASLLWKVDEGEEREGETFFYNGWLTDGALEYTMKALDAAGLASDDIVGDIKNCEGKSAVIVVQEEVYKGETREKVRFINAVGGGYVMSGENRLTFAEKLKEKVKAKKALAGQKAEEKVQFDV